MSTPILQEPTPPTTGVTLEQLLDGIDRLTEKRARQAKAVNLTEATRMLGLKDTRVTRKLVQDKTIRGRHAGRVLLISLQSIDEWLGNKDAR